jgi:hypothetical protein
MASQEGLSSMEWNYLRVVVLAVSTELKQVFMLQFRFTADEVEDCASV